MIQKESFEDYTEGNPNYQDERVALISQFSKIKSGAVSKVILDGFLLIIVYKGSISITIDDAEYSLKGGDLFACYPQNVLERSVNSDDVEVRVIYLTTDFAETISKRGNVDWTIGMMLKRHEILHATPHKLSILRKYFDLAKQKLQSPTSKYKGLALEMIFTAMLYELSDIHSTSDTETHTTRYSAAENLLQRFVSMLNKPGNKPRSVTYYAEHFCVSPKYFSAVCKQMTGKSASLLINDAIIRSARILLNDNKKSLKQIADELGFKNQSHFGTFFRRHEGITPQLYRDRNMGRE